MCSTTSEGEIASFDIFVEVSAPMAEEGFDIPSQQVTSIQDLPAECLGLIFKLLKANDKNACSEVSKSFRDQQQEQMLSSLALGLEAISLIEGHTMQNRNYRGGDFRVIEQKPTFFDC